MEMYVRNVCLKLEFMDLTTYLWMLGRMLLEGYSEAWQNVNCKLFSGLKSIFLLSLMRLVCVRVIRIFPETRSAKLTCL